MQPEEFILESLDKIGVETWSKINSLESISEVVLIDRKSGTITSQNFGKGWITYSYDIDLQCYTISGQKAAYELAERVLEALLEGADNNFRVDISFYSVEWLPPLNKMSGASLGINVTTTKGE